jgi:hypothetical protein
VSVYRAVLVGTIALILQLVVFVLHRTPYNF